MSRPGIMESISRLMTTVVFLSDMATQGPLHGVTHNPHRSYNVSNCESECVCLPYPTCGVNT